MRRICALQVILSAVVVAAAVAAPAQGATRTVPSSQVQVLTKGQRILATRGTVRIVVRAGRSGTHLVRLRVRESRRPTIAAGARRVRLARGKRRTVSVRLSPGARRLIGRCVNLRIFVVVSRSGRATVHRSRLLRADRRACDGPLAGGGASGSGGGSGSTPAGGNPSGGDTTPGGGTTTGVGTTPGAGTGTAGSATGGSGPGTGGSGDGGTPPPAPVAPGFDVTNADRCDPLDPAVCLQPFSNDHFTKADATAKTRRRVALDPASMPKNAAGKSFAPTELNLADGFSPGSSLVTRVPGLDGPAAAHATNLPAIDQPGASLMADSPVVVVNTRTGARHPVWAEVDANPADPSQRNLIIRPARNFEEGEHYVVGLRRMKRADGSAIPATRAFQVYRDGIVTTAAVVEARRPAMDATLKALTKAGVDRGGLFLAWDFTVATPATIAARMLSIRDRAFAELGDTNLADRTVTGKAPTFQLNPDLPDTLPELPGAPVSFEELDGVRNFTPEQDPKIARVIRGTFVTPCFLSTPGCANGGSFLTPTDPFVPTQLPANVSVAQFTCEIPRRALVEGTREKLRPNLYGHGLFGGQGEVQQGQQKSFAQEHGFLPCAADWDGMSTKDVPTALAVLQDLSLFPMLIDHVQQGFLQQLFLGRLMIHPDGFAANAAFQRPGGDSVIDTHRLFYDGNSQGGIYGGSLTAIAPDFERATLGVPGMNYSTLLPRSVDFDTYAKGSFGGVDAPAGGLYDNYPNELERPLLLALLQMPWDRGDPNGYAQHMTTDPLPNTPTHEVLMHSSLGDHQVADVTAEVEARTIGARVHRPGLEPLRRRFTFDPAFGRTGPPGDPAPYSLLDSLGAPGYSAGGSGVVFWDIGPPRGALGEPAPPAANIPPRSGKDPHEAPRNSALAREQKSAFLRDGGRIVDVCMGPCFAFDYTGGAPQP